MKSWISHRIQVISNLYFQCAKFEYDKDHFKQFLWRKQFLTHVNKQDSLKTCLSFGVNVLFIVYHEHWVLLFITLTNNQVANCWIELKNKKPHLREEGLGGWTGTLRPLPLAYPTLAMFLLFQSNCESCGIKMLP